MNNPSTSQRLGEAMRKALRHWKGEQQGGPATAIFPGPPPPPFSIAISRQAGTNGPAIARKVAERLGWTVYDYQLLQQIAEEMGLRTQLIESVDEKHRSWVRESLAALFAAPGVSESGYVRQLVETLLSLAAHGRCVIVGRGAVFVLPRTTTLRVRLVAPHADRIANVQQRFGISREDAARWIDRTDHDRTLFVRTYFQATPENGDHYDLTLNTARFTVEECSDLIVDALGHLQTPAVIKEDVVRPQPISAP